MLLVKNSDNDGTNSVEISYYSFIGFVIIQGRQKILFFIFWIRGECSLKGVDLSSQFSVLFFLETYQIACVLALHDDNAMLINKHYVMTHRPCQKYFASRGQKASKRCKNMDHHLIDKNIAAGGTAG